MSTEIDYSRQYTDEHGVTTPPAWNPTPEKMMAYKERELQLAVHNLRRVPAEYRTSHPTLHSAKTQTQACAVLAEREGLGEQGKSAR